MNEKILIVDDDLDYLTQKKYELEKEGFVITTAQSRNEANQKLKENQPDIAIIDLMMDEMDDGFVLSYEIKKSYPDIPVVIVTAVTNRTGMEFESITEKEKSWIKADKVFTKPIRTEQLVREIRRLVKA